jgi:hypothetical protein
VFFNGFTHGELNKDGPDGPKGAVLHWRARDLATLQNSYEWCRLVRAAGLSNRDGLLLTTWVRAPLDPRPDGTPCAKPGRAGADPVVVSILRVKVRHNGDDGAGEVQLSAAVYDSPNPLRRFVQSESRGGVVTLDDGDSMPAHRLPRPLALCVPRGTGATFALYGWDNDDRHTPGGLSIRLRTTKPRGLWAAGPGC